MIHEYSCMTSFFLLNNKDPRLPVAHEKNRSLCWDLARHFFETRSGLVYGVKHASRFGSVLS
jgi:hypothetical protein